MDGINYPKRNHQDQMAFTVVIWENWIKAKQKKEEYLYKTQ